MDDKPERLILITGNPVDGYRYSGPYSYPEAEKVVETFDHTDYWFAVLEAPHA